MALYMPPIARKKKVQGHYRPDSFRVISTHAEETHPSFQVEKTVHEPGPQLVDQSSLILPDIYNRQTQVLPKSVPDYRANRPHPGGCGFLRYNVRYLNEPICSVYTEATHEEQNSWWPSRTSKEPLKVPPKTNDTIYRGDYSSTDDSRKSAGSTRHSANPNKDPALGTVPVNFLRDRDGDQRLFKENISYEHQYDCRVDQNYPRRGKRQGSFVWKQMHKDETRGFIDRQMSEINSEFQPTEPLTGEDGNLGKFNNGVMMSSTTRSPTNLTKDNSQAASSKSVSFVEEKNGGADVKPSPSDINIAGINTVQNTTEPKTVNHNNENSQNIQKNGDNNLSSNPNSKNGNRNGTITYHNRVQPELMESLGISDQISAA